MKIVAGYIVYDNDGEMVFASTRKKIAERFVRKNGGTIKRGEVWA